MEHAIEAEEVSVSRSGRGRGQSPPAAGTPGSITLGPRDSLAGTLTVDGDIRVEGTVEGELRASGDVDIDQKAKLTARVEGRTVTVRGSVKGNIAARRRLVVGGSGMITGDVRAPKLQVDDGAMMNGNISMGPVEELKFEQPAPEAEEPQPQES